jgi:hypothetical protein
MMAAVRSMISKDSRRQVEQTQPASCACDQRGTCGFHYALMNDREQVLVRARAGIVGFGRGRVAGQVGSCRDG